MAGVVESVKAAADVYMPVTGEIVEVNEALRADPSLANSDPLGAGWFFKVKLADAAQLNDLMDGPPTAPSLPAPDSFTWGHSCQRLFLKPSGCNL